MTSAERQTTSDEMSTDEFISWPGDGSGIRYELVDGRLRAMSPPSSKHGLIQSTASYLLNRHLKSIGLPCVVTTNPPIIPRLGANNNVRSPDLGVSCAKTATDRYDLDQPILLIEILSPSNRADTWSNVWTYATIPSVQQVLVLESTKIEAKLLTRQTDGTWPDRPDLFGPAQVLPLTCITFDVPCDTFYESVAFES
jgi:Uma2 family endonuclease